MTKSTARPLMKTWSVTENARTQGKKEFIMARITRYFSQSAGRDRVMQVLGWFSVVGAAIVSAILLVDAFLR